VNTSRTLTVPAGQILVINALSSSGNVALRLNDNANLPVYLSASNTVFLPRPILLPENTTLKPSSSATITIFGALVSSYDLYAAVPSQFQSVGLAGTAVHGVLRTASSRPAVVTVQKTGDLVAQGWATDPTVAVRRQTDTTLRSILFTADASVTTAQFYRASVRATQ